MKKLKLLVVDDDELVHDTFRLCIPDHWELLSSQDLKFPRQDFVHAAFVDMHLTGNMAIAEGLQVISELSKAHPQLEIIAMSGDLNRDLMEHCLKNGASRFLAKPLSTDEILLLLEKMEALWQMRGVGGPRSKQKIHWVGSSDVSEDVRRFVSQMMGERTPILLEGESGTGKEVVAQLLRQQDDSRPFVPVNVAAIPKDLFESEFFGHIRGAFTGAVQNCTGYAEQAHGGDLFLDEIEALSSEHQAKLLRFLESGEYKRVGDRDVRRSNVRVIAATNENLKKRVEAGTFREDLLFRLSGHHFLLPPLRERPDDIPELCQFFAKQQKPFLLKSFSEDAMAKLKGYPWPGNVRELKRVVEQVCVVAPLPVIRAEDIHKVILPLSSSSSGNVFDFERGLGALMQEHERNILSTLLQKTEDVEEMIRWLKISRSSLYKKLKDHDLELKKSN